MLKPYPGGASVWELNLMLAVLPPVSTMYDLGSLPQGILFAVARSPSPGPEDTSTNWPPH